MKYDIEKMKNRLDIHEHLSEIAHKDAPDNLFTINHDYLYKLLNEIYDLGFKDGYNLGTNAPMDEYGNWKYE